MQKMQNTQNLRFFYLSHLALLMGLVLWFNPFTETFCQKIDIATFQILNGSLIESPSWQSIFGILNHKQEARLNLLFAALVNLWAIVATHDPALRRLRIKQTIYFWVFFQIGFTFQDFIINHWLEIKRDSPSLVLVPFVKLSEILQNPNIKDSSTSSFLGGHAFAMVYWASFTALTAPKRIACLGILFAFILCLPRLFSGAHWLSDEIFGALLAWVWLSWVLVFKVHVAKEPAFL